MMKILRNISLLLLLSCFLVAQTHAQNRRYNPKNRFGAGVVMGVNAAQIDGDNYAGYDKYGLTGGVRGLAKLTRQSELVIEMLVTQKGSRNPGQRVQGRSNRSIRLNYIEVPLLYHLKFPAQTFQGSLEAGVSFSRLLGYAINENPNSSQYLPFSDVESAFNRNEWSFIIGGGVYLTEHWRLDIRHSVGMNLLYKNPNWGEKGPEPTTFWNVGIEQKEIKLLRNYLFSVRCAYLF